MRNSGMPDFDRKFGFMRDQRAATRIAAELRKRQLDGSGPGKGLIGNIIGLLERMAEHPQGLSGQTSGTVSEKP